MIRKLILIFVFFTLTNCAAPGTALLGPAFTGATTKSAARASLSFSSNQLIKKIHNDTKNVNDKIIKIVKKLEPTLKKTNKLNFHN
jgi:hypothetical protein